MLNVDTTKCSSWVNQIRDVAYDVEDVIDEFMFQVERKRQQRFNNLKFLNFLHVCMCLPDKLPLVNELNERISVINRTLENILINKRRKEERFPTVEETNVVGMKNDVKAVKGKLSYFPAESNKSRVLITTRREDIDVDAYSDSYKLQLLAEKKSWELFLNKVGSAADLYQKGKEMLEDIAEDYLNELIQRSMIQVADTRADGRVKSCRIHDLLRDLAISEAKEEKLFEVDENIDVDMPPTSVRRLCIHQNISPHLQNSNLRSLILNRCPIDDGYLQMRHLNCFNGEISSRVFLIPQVPLHIVSSRNHPETTCGNNTLPSKPHATQTVENKLEGRSNGDTREAVKLEDSRIIR
ncbi:hypothetical protein AAG906_029275 [Vitis piasezkii]